MAQVRTLGGIAFDVVSGLVYAQRWDDLGNFSSRRPEDLRRTTEISIAKNASRRARSSARRHVQN